MSQPCAPLPEHLQQRGGDPDLVAKEYLHIIEAAINNHPRSLQRRIGPSEVGHPCSRRIGYQLLDFDDINTYTGVAWKPAVGTAVHAWLESAFDAANLAHDVGDGSERWLVETTVDVGQIGGVTITGHADLYDRVTGTVIDHKVVGNPQLSNYAANGPGQQYRTQAHLYGRGFERAGHPVDTVMVAFLPRADELHKRVIWHEPYDEQIALDGLQRAEGIALATGTLGAQALESLPTADAYCYRCPFYRAGSNDLATGCPGDPEATGNRRQANPFPGLVA